MTQDNLIILASLYEPGNSDLVASDFALLEDFLFSLLATWTLASS